MKNSKENVQLHKILKILQHSFKKYEDERKKIKNIEAILVEWKEVARRLEYVFLIIAFLTITLTHVVLFGKYFVENTKMANKCGCDHSFIQNI